MVEKNFYQTDIGLIPLGWKPYRIGDVVEFSGGSQPDKSTFENRPTKGYIRLIQIRDYKTDKFETYIPEALARKKCSKEDVMIGRYGPPIFQILRGIEGAYNVALIKATPSSELDSEYLYHFIKNENLFNLMDSLSRRSSGQTGVELPALKAYPLPLPNLHEQKVIAKALSDVDELIVSLEKLIAKKRDIKTATMQQLLTGKKRLPGFGEGKGTKQTELGEIPEDWDVVSLADIGKPIIGLTYKPSDVAEHGTLVLRSSNVQQNILAYENNVFVDMTVPERVFVEEGDLLICVRNGSRDLIGKCALIDKNAAGYAFGAFMSVFRSKDSKFVFYQFQSNIIQRQINEIMGATINQITNKGMGSFKIPFPKASDERNAIYLLLSEFDAELVKLNQQLNKTKAIKQGMMQELLTGRTRLVDVAETNKTKAA